MSYAREPVLQPAPIESLRPTQITVGMREVEEKRKRLRKQKPQKIGSLDGISAAVSFAGHGGAANVMTTKMITANTRTAANLNARLSGSCAMSPPGTRAHFRYLEL